MKILRMVCWLYWVCAVVAAGSVLAVDTETEEAAAVTRDGAADTNLPLVVYIGNNQYPPTRIEAFQHAGYTVGVYNLDAPRNLEERLTRDLPADRQAAEAQVQQRFEALPVEAVIEMFQPAALLVQWDIRKIPVFVFDRKAAVYGVTDAARALSLWESWKGGGE
jgi:integrating conjugative element protein (TIGR03757 family)